MGTVTSNNSYGTGKLSTHRLSLSSQSEGDLLFLLTDNAFSDVSGNFLSVIVVITFLVCYISKLCMYSKVSEMPKFMYLFIYKRIN